MLSDPYPDATPSATRFADNRRTPGTPRNLRRRSGAPPDRKRTLVARSGLPLQTRLPCAWRGGIEDVPVRCAARTPRVAHRSVARPGCAQPGWCPSHPCSHRCVWVRRPRSMRVVAPHVVARPRCAFLPFLFSPKAPPWSPPFSLSSTRPMGRMRERENGWACFLPT